MKTAYFVKHIKHFNLSEIRKASYLGIESIDSHLMYTLDKLREKLGVPIKITELNKGKHVKGSWHTRFKKCRAVDFKVLGSIPKNKVLQAMLDVGFKGIGMYHGFYHGDVRPRYKLWKRIKGKYLPLITKL